MTEKVVREGKVAVLVSGGYGSGWYSWNREAGQAFLFDPIMVAGVEVGDLIAVERRAKEILPGCYIGSNLKDLAIEWVEQGSLFRIDEYDGSETLVIQSDDDWIVA